MSVEDFEVVNGRVVPKGDVRLKSHMMEDLYKVKVDPFNSDNPGESRVKKEILTTALEKMPEHQHNLDVLEIGCGIGNTLDVLFSNSFIPKSRENRYIYLYTGIDVSKEALKQAVINITNKHPASKSIQWHFELWDIEKHPYSRRYDLVLLLETMYYFQADTWHQAADNCLESVRLGGYLLVSDYLIRSNYRDYFKKKDNCILVHEWVVVRQIDGEKPENVKVKLYKRIS